MITTIIFDWGGTCSRGSVVEAFAAALSGQAGISKRRIGQAFEKNNRKYLLGRISSGEFWSSFSRETGIRRGPAYFNRLFLESGRANPGMLGLVRRLGKRYRTGLLSDSYRELADFITGEYGLDSLFDAMVFSNREGVKKPAKKMFLLLLERLGARPEECVFIDDKQENVRAARALGMEGIVFRGEGKLKKSLANMGIEGS